MTTTAFNSVASMVRAARGTDTQEVFAAKIGKKPYSVSRYESGDASPPAEVINKCLEIISSRSRTPSATDIAKAVRDQLGGLQNEPIRTAIWAIIRSTRASSGRMKSASKSS